MSNLQHDFAWIINKLHDRRAIKLKLFIRITRPIEVILFFCTWFSASGVSNCFRTLACSAACTMDAWAAPSEHDAKKNGILHYYLVKVTWKYWILITHQPVIKLNTISQH